MSSTPVAGTISPDALPRCLFEDGVPDGLRKTVERLLEEWSFLPGERGIRLSVLPGGANNVNLIVGHGESRWVLKVRDAEASLAGTSIVAAIEAQSLAASLGLAPPILATSLPDGHFLAAFVLGETLRPQRLREPAMVPQILATLKGLHACQFQFREFDIFEDIRNFMRGAEKLGGTYPDSYTGLWKIAQRFEAILASAGAPTGFCHNDLVPQNFIACADGVKLVDFDYAGQTLVAVDLASVTSQAEMSDDETEAFLQLYDPGLDAGQIARVQVLRFVNALREVAWAAMAEPFMADKTTLLEGWSYRSHADGNIRLAETLIRAHSAESLAARAGAVRPGALF